MSLQLLIVLMSRGLAIFNTLIHNIFLQETIYNSIPKYFHFDLQYKDIVIILVLIVMVVYFDEKMLSNLVRRIKRFAEPWSFYE